MKRHVILEICVTAVDTGIPWETGTGERLAMRVFSSANLRPGRTGVTFDPKAKKDFLKFLDNPERFGKKVFIHATADESSETGTMLHFKSMILAEAFAYIGVVEGGDVEGFLDCAQE